LSRILLGSKRHRPLRSRCRCSASRANQPGRAFQEKFTFTRTAASNRLWTQNQL